MFILSSFSHSTPFFPLGQIKFKALPPPDFSVCLVLSDIKVLTRD